jgi:hypothetical protein
MMQALQDMHWHTSEPASAFHPRTYNLSQAADAHAFDLDFKWSAAAALLRLLLKHGGFHARFVPSERHARVALAVCAARLAFLRCAAPTACSPAACCSSFSLHVHTEQPHSHCALCSMHPAHQHAA